MSDPKEVFAQPDDLVFLAAPPSGAAGLVAALSDAHTTAALLDGAAATTKADLMSQAATRLGFPEHFGHNWDALADSLPEALWRSDRARGVLVFDNADQLLAGEPDAEVENLLTVLRGIVRAFAGDSPPFVVKVLLLTQDAAANRIARIVRKHAGG